MTKLIIREYGDIFGTLSEVPGSDELPQDCFDRLKDMALNNDELSKVFTAGRVKGKDFSIRATSYVGVIRVSEQSQVEILPKISLSDNDDEARHILIKMLSKVYHLNIIDNLPADFSQQANTSILEHFIGTFLYLVEKVLSIGLCAGYSRVEANENYLRGKLTVNENIRYNSARLSKFYCTYDLFSENRPENRILHSTLALVYQFAQRREYRQRCHRLLNELAHIPISMNYKQDFADWDQSYESNYYASIRPWCELLLMQSPTFKSGNISCKSLLFSMPQLFERYVSMHLQEQLNEDSSIRLSTQSAKKKVYFGSWDEKAGDLDVFRLKPDIIICKHDSNHLIIDTKWKGLDISSTNKYNLSISQNDLYQVYTYAHYFKPTTRTLMLVYPATTDFNEIKRLFLHKSEIGLEDLEYKVMIVPFDLKKDKFGIFEFKDLLKQL